MPGGSICWSRSSGTSRAGQLTYLHAMKLAEAVTPFDDQTTAKIEQQVLPRAPPDDG